MVNVLKLSLKLILILSFLDHLLPIINLKMAKINFMADALLADSKKYMSGKELRVAFANVSRKLIHYLYLEVYFL